LTFSWIQIGGIKNLRHGLPAQAPRIKGKKEKKRKVLNHKGHRDHREVKKA